MATLKVLHISTHGYNVGGAIATYRLHQGLQLIGIPSKMLCLYNTHTKDDTIRFSVNTNFINRLKNRIYYKSIKSDYKPYRHTKPADAQPLAHVHTAFRVDLAQQVAEADIIHLHEISHFVDLPSFFREVKKPVVWTFHQMNSFTGGIPDMIKNNKAGFLAETGNPVALAEAIRRVLSDKEMLGANAGKSVEEKFTLQHQAMNYLRVYEEMV